MPDILSAVNTTIHYYIGHHRKNVSTPTPTVTKQLIPTLHWHTLCINICDSEAIQSLQNSKTTE